MLFFDLYSFPVKNIINIGAWASIVEVNTITVGFFYFDIETDTAHITEVLGLLATASS